MVKRIVFSKALWLPLIATGVLLVSAIYLFQTRIRQSPGESLASFLSATDTTGFEQVTPGKALVFPDDHGAHPGFRQEWWYFVGNLKDGQENRYGFQLTFFRFANDVSADIDDSVIDDSAWHAGQNWMAHLAITDVGGNRFIAAEDFSRQALDLTGATAAPFSVWLNSWSVRQVESTCDRCFSLELTATHQSHALQLKLNSRRKPVLQGSDGYSLKDASGNTASWYYSIPDFEVAGTLTLDDQLIPVTGNSWMDREWSSAILGEQQSGWDWFALHLEDGAKLMIFQVRNRNETDQPYRHGIYIDANGKPQKFDSNEINLSVLKTWQSPESGVVYPSVWQLKIDSSSFESELTVRPAINDQELALLFTYYEGVAFASGTINGLNTSAEGYLEMTGYN